MTAPTFVNAGTASDIEGGSGSPALPGSRVNGNLLIAYVGNGGSSGDSWSISAGWTVFETIQQSNAHFTGAYRYVDGSETAPTFTYTGTAIGSFRVLQYTGVVASSPIGAIADNFASSGVTPATCGAITSTAPASLAVNICMGPTAFVPTGWSSETSSAGDRATGISDKTLTSLGDSSGSISQAISPGTWTEVTFEIRSQAPPLNLVPAAGSLSLTTAAPTLIIGSNFVPAAGSLTLSADAPALGAFRAPASALLGLTGAAPSLVIGTNLLPAAGSLGLSAAAPILKIGDILTPAAASLTLSANPPVIGTKRTPASGSLSLVGAVPTVLATASYNLRPASGSLRLSSDPPRVLIITAIAGRGPFYFAWVDPDEKVFGPQHYRYDETIFVATRRLVESDIPELTIEIHNPRIGLLGPGRKQWCWFSWKDPEGDGSVEPLFFGRLVAVPGNLFAEVLQLRFTARPQDYLEQLQKLAETLKVRPFYDGLFLDQQHRDDPHSILEGWSSLYHVDAVPTLGRLPGTVTISDILAGEDGIEIFTSHDAFYDGFGMELEQNPKTVVRVDMEVGWNQGTTGIVDIGNRVLFSYSGDGLFGSWPKPLSSLGGGWSVFDSTAVDSFGINRTVMATWTWTFRNADKTHEDGDALSTDERQTIPILRATSVSGTVSSFTQSGVLDPFGVDDDGDPAPVNIPLTVQYTTMYVPLWRVDTSLKLRYGPTKRQRIEHCTFTLQSDLQAITLDQTVLDYGELIKLQGADVGVEFLDLDNWLGIENSPVLVGKVIQPDIGRPLPGGTSLQVVTSIAGAGFTGTTEPNFSDFPGVTTIDNQVTWTSLGTNDLGEPPDWTQSQEVPIGKLIIPLLRLWEYYSSMIAPGQQQFPAVGVDVGLYTIVNANGSYQICTLSGVTNPFNTHPPFSPIYGTIIIDGTVRWESLGTTLPQGTSMYLCTVSGQTGVILPDFSDASAIGSVVVDNGVHWLNVGLAAVFAGIPVGGNPGNVIAASYFPSSRGLRSVEYGLSVARAHLRHAGRAGRVSWEARFAKVARVNCRMNAQIFNDLLPGGQASGKIIETELLVDGDRSLMIGKVKIGCGVGFGIAVISVLGTPEYVQDNAYFNSGEVQRYDGSTIVPPSVDDIGYTPPVSSQTDDGLVFPLNKGDAVITEVVHGDLQSQINGINSAIATARRIAQIEAGNPFPGLSPIAKANTIAILSVNTVEYQLKLNPIWYDLQLRPVDGGPFEADYELITTRLTIPKGIDLEAPSTP